MCFVESTILKFSSRGVFKTNLSLDGWGDGSRRAKWIYPSFTLCNWATAVVYLKPKHTRAGARRGCFGSLSEGDSPPFLDALDDVYMTGSWGDRNRGYKGLLSNHLKGGEAGWDFQVYDVASVIGPHSV